ncbi:hypothetical protein K1T71_004934 [Dendrolimus kikuchii]|uniref:Uncharacterized protein n=1 Tax=Dendrolimus kikuchii TaxID=765133 RepID=A0ACC1D5U5_9NEOP|nr:hypothetical protein K1T71_004934 [Dendrolimus kikuchii]
MKTLKIIVFLTICLCLKSISAYRIFEIDGVKTILALENETISVECKADIYMAYCGFVHPSGKRFSGLDQNTGRCLIKINATNADSGLWKCHIGGTSIGLEIMQVINVRIVNHVAAVQKNVTGRHGKPVTLACTTAKGFTPIRYCRFEPPNGVPFSINPDITDMNAILNRYYYPRNMSLDRGDCAVTIRKLKYEDVGLWTCGAGLDDRKEHTDVISLEVEGFYTMSKASATGIASGVIGSLIFLSALGFIVWKKRRFLGSVTIPRETPELVEEHELERLSGDISAQPHSSLRSEGLPRIVVQSPSPASGSTMQ